jgi:hypothetical protein
MAAASAGHLHCLKSLQQGGLFLGLDSPDRGSAGELRKLQVWEAAHSACEADHAGVLSWLFASGWPTEIDACIPWHLRDVVAREHWDIWKLKYMQGFTFTLSPEKMFLPELQLYRYAMQKRSPACLQALLNSGCRSKWVSDMAALEGRDDFWDLAAEHGCPVDLRSWLIATRKGHSPILQRLLDQGLSSAARATHKDRIFALQTDEISVVLQTCARDAAEGGHTDCLAALWNTGFLRQKDVGLAIIAAMQRGHLACLQVLLGYVFPTAV